MTDFHIMETQCIILYVSFSTCYLGARHTEWLFICFSKGLYFFVPYDIKYCFNVIHLHSVEYATLQNNNNILR